MAAHPCRLPPPGNPERWPWLQGLRRQRRLALEPWLRAIETAAVTPDPDLLASLAPHLDAGALRRLLVWWLGQPDPTPPLPQLPGPWRDASIAALLRQALDRPLAMERQVALLPLLGHQRDPADAARLCELVASPAPTPVRRAALEALSLGLAAWPRQRLRACLERLVPELNGPLAATAVDLLARLPAARTSLVPLTRRSLDPEVAARLRRRLARQGADPMLLLVHGRAGGQMPEEIEELAAELRERRASPVVLRALTDPSPPPPPRVAGRPLALVPLLLVPGGHVRHDVGAVLVELRCGGPVRRWPFLGAWPAWQAALASEFAGLAASAPPRLLHHPLEGPLAARYLAHLGQRIGALPVAAPYSAPMTPIAATAPPGTPIPLALATCRLTEALAAGPDPAAARPLLARQGLRAALLQLLESLP